MRRREPTPRQPASAADSHDRAAQTHSASSSLPRCTGQLKVRPTRPSTTGSSAPPSARSRGRSAPIRRAVLGPTRPAKRPAGPDDSRPGEPPLVGRRRRRLPRRARRLPRGGRLRVVPGTGLREADVAAARRRRGAGGSWRSAAGRRRAPGGWRGRARTVVAFDLSAGMLRARQCGRRPDRDRRPAGAGRRLRRCRSRDGAFDIACSAFGAIPFVADSAAVMARGGPGAAARRSLGVLGDPPDALDLPRRPGRARPDRRPVVLRPVARTSRSTTTACRPTSSTTARWATGSGSSSAPGSRWWT